jgi:hypothetical protein
MMTGENVLRVVRRIGLWGFVVGLWLPTSTVSIVYAATITVTTTADVIHRPGCATDGFTLPCSLRDATIFANANRGTTITLPAGIYTLTIPPDATDDATTGDLNLTANVIINGADAATTIIQASATDSSAGIDRVLAIGNPDPSSVTATINNVTVRNGKWASSQSGGGGMYIGIFATAILNDSVIRGNTAINTASVGTVFGGGIYNFDGTLTLNGTTVSGNSVTGNAANGGGIANDLDRPLTLNDSIVSDNTADGGGGGIINSGALSLNNSVISGNRASSGGGIVSNGTRELILNNSTISSNVATVGEGGGISIGVMGLTTLTNSTISGNIASTGGAIFGFAYSVTINATTIVGNSSGINFSSLFFSMSTLSLRNSLLANAGANCSGPLTSSDYNLSSDASCMSLTQPHDMNNINPLIGPLAGNGGPTQTHALLSGSPALNRIPAVGANCPATDQRGVARPQGLGCDIGAYEAVPVPVPASRPGGSPDPNGPPPPAPLSRPGASPSGTGGPSPLPPHR